MSIFGHQSITHNTHEATNNKFCTRCQSIMSIPNESGKMECKNCQYTSQYNPSLYKNTIIYSKLIETKLKARHDEMSLNNNKKDTLVQKRSVINEPCPNESCNSTFLEFYTRQMRSVDEGQTVFYECKQCGHTFSTDT